jgi:5-(carboxyamino)imidazole ribonucleotide synthase
LNETADVGIVGAGQLARMMLQAAIPLGLRVQVLAASPSDGGAIVASNVVIGSPDDPEALRAIAQSCRALTFDHELVSVPVLQQLEAEGYCIRPASSVMAVSQDKRLQRDLFSSCGLPVPRYAIVQEIEEAERFADETEYPVAVKAARGGYDGRGIWKVETENQLKDLTGSLLAREITPVIEPWVRLEREVAILIARRPGGETVVYPLVETVQERGMLKELVAPAEVPESLHETAAWIAIEVASALEVVGLLAVEFFVVDGELWINEIATRPHNSGHYTIEGTVTSQFEQHLRAVLDLPLGATGLTAPHVVTVNVVGSETQQDSDQSLRDALTVPGAHVHLYGKSWRPGRKLGHVTVAGDDLELVRSRARAAAAYLAGG